MLVVIIPLCSKFSELFFVPEVFVAWLSLVYLSLFLNLPWSNFCKNLGCIFMGVGKGFYFFFFFKSIDLFIVSIYNSIQENPDNHPKVMAQKS